MSKVYKKNEHNLPVPRLQARIKQSKQGPYTVEYSLIRSEMGGLVK